MLAGKKADPVPISAQGNEKGKTRDKLAKRARVGKTKFSQGDYILNKAPEYIRRMWRANDLTTNHAYELAKLLEKAHKRTIALMLKSENVDREIVPILDRLAKNKSDTLEEIELTGYVQWGDASDAIPFGKVSALQLQKYLDFKAKEHKEQAKEKRRQEVAERGKDATVDAIEFIRADFREILQGYEANSIDIIFTDPPYHEEYLYLWQALAEQARRVLKPGGLLIAYSGQTHLDRVMASVSGCLDFHWMMAARNRRGDLRVWNKHFWNGWKPIIVWSKGETIHRWLPDFYSGATEETKALHDWAQPIEEAEQILKYLAEGHELIVDPMCGSGSIPIAAAKLGLKAVGIEISEQDYYMAKDRAVQYLQETTSDAPVAA